MSEQSYRKPLLVALAGTVVFTAAFYAYNHYSNQPKPPPAQSSALHRSNAIRRPRHRRRWRPGFDEISLDYDPTERAINHLEERNERRQGYGEYQNKWFFPTPQDAIGVDLTLIPCNLRSIYVYLLQNSPAPLSAYQQDCLRLHVHGVFTQNFLRQEYPEGYIIGDDAYIVARGLELLDVAEEIVYEVIKAFDEGEFHLSEEWSPLDAPVQSPRMPAVQVDGAVEELAPRDALDALAHPRRDDDEDSEISYHNHNDDDPEGSQNMLDLLYHIAGEQARREGYIHRGVECNNCGIHPIQGIRYHCANCFDFDLCESCEANSGHIKSHVFFKIRIPAPSRGNIKQVLPKWYPGVPNAFPTSLPREISKPLLEQTGMDRTELDALYEQFKCLAGHYWSSDPVGLGMAIDRKAFDLYFIPSDKPSPANLIYDRIFAFYDTNNDGLIGFDEYIRGLARLQDKSRHARLKRIFEGYDLDSDGYVDRKDFLRIFRAYFALSKELSREMINSQEDFGYVEEEIREVVRGSQPISAAFGGGTLYGHESRSGQDKHQEADGDLHLDSGPNGVLQPDTDARGDRARAIGNVAMNNNRIRSYRIQSFRPEPVEDEALLPLPIGSNFAQMGLQSLDEPFQAESAGPDPPLQTYAWSEARTPEPQDVVEALGQEVPLDDITDPVDRTRVLYAQSQRLNKEWDEAERSTRAEAVQVRWRRRQFYLDEEEGLSRPPGYTEPDSSDSDDEPSTSRPKKNNHVTTTSPRRPSTQSRSSSKVRFDDSAIDTDYETRSNGSSRSLPVNERWGGYELGQAEADIGKDILYQAVQQGFNELLDALFKEKEDEWSMAQGTRRDRIRYRKELLRFKEEAEAARQQRMEALEAADRLRTGEQSPQVEAPGAEGPTETKCEHGESSAPDPEDHIELMFGNTGPVDSLNAEQQKGSSGTYRDPTLPQFRPDESEASSTPSQSQSQPPPRSQSQPHSFSDDPNNFRAVYYDLWTRHDAIDSEALQRGGYGKLNFAEFRRKMVAEDDVSRVMREEEEDGEGHDKDAKAWESSADLGRLAFVGTWLEMASF